MQTMTEKYDKLQPVFNYHMLRNALDNYHANLSELNEANFNTVYQKASKSYEIESLVLSSAEARDIIISDDELSQAVAEISSRYSNEDELGKDLEANGLDIASLRQAMYRELVFNAAMQKVAAKSAAINDIDIRLFYELHRERFETPEQRTARHILITINNDYPENTRMQATTRMNQLAGKLAGRTNRFKDFARRYSECPTAMEGGKLGKVQQGQLYPELDSALFAMQENTISEIIETEVGLHILWCEKIHPLKPRPLSQVADQIKELLVSRRQRNCQKAWLDELKQQSSSRQEQA